MSITCKLKTYPDDVKEASKEVWVKNHWSLDDRIYLVVDGSTHVLIKRDLLNAIAACVKGGL